MKIDFKALLIGLLLGIGVPLSMGQRAAEPAHKLDADYRYQISTTSAGTTGVVVFVLDHETNKIYSRVVEVDVRGLDVKSITGGR